MVITNAYLRSSSISKLLFRYLLGENGQTKQRRTDELRLINNIILTGALFPSFCLLQRSNLVCRNFRAVLFHESCETTTARQYGITHMASAKTDSESASTLVSEVFDRENRSIATPRVARVVEGVEGGSRCHDPLSARLSSDWTDGRPRVLDSSCASLCLFSAVSRRQY